MERSLSYKNQLQEYFQARHQRLPEYTHQLLPDGSWQTTVSLWENGSFTGVGMNKKAADKLAASQALEWLNKREPPHAITTPPSTPPKHPIGYVLLDLENSPTYTKWTNTAPIVVEAFAGKLSSYPGKNLQVLYPFVHRFHIVDSGIKDAADHAISVRAGELMSDDCPPRHLFIVSRDRFAVALKDILQQRWPNQCIFYHCISLDECDAALSNTI